MEKTKAVIYCNTICNNIDLQERIVRDYCKWLGYEVIDTYIDDNYYNYDDTRPAYNRLLNDLAENKFDVIVTKSLFTLNASTLKLRNILKLLKKYNCNLIAMHENYNFNRDERKEDKND